MEAQAWSRSTTSSSSGSKDHVVVFPFMAKGHIIPLIHLSAALSARGAAVTFVTTPGNAAFVTDALLPDPNVHLLLLPFPAAAAPSLPAGCESTDLLPSHDLLYPAFLQATKLLREPFAAALRRMADSGALPLCVVSDFFLGWTLDVCRGFGVPRLVSHGMGVFAMTLCKGLVASRAHLAAAAAGEDSFHVPGTREDLRLTAADVPYPLRACDPDADPAFRFAVEDGEADAHSWGVLVNSFQELERSHVEPFEAFLLSPGARAWLVGPLCLYRRRRASASDDSGDRDHCLRWLDARPPGSVVYVSFGTQTDVSEEQLDQVALGLDLSGYDFVLVVRSAAGWSPPEGSCSRGLLVRGWSPQAEALGHPATGGFLCHCGWNSVLEGLVAGVPFLAWPMSAEQPLNAKYVVEELGAGIRLREPPPPAKAAEEGGATSTGGLVGKTEICEGVREIMGGGGERGRKARERAAELGKAARAAVAGGGSSERCLGMLMEELRRVGRAGTAINGCEVAVNATV